MHEPRDPADASWLPGDPLDPTVGGDPDVGAVQCDDCPVGRASGVGRGQFCPFVTHEVQHGRVLCRAGDPATHVWWIKRGVVALSRGRDTDRLAALRLPGSFVGLEGLIGDSAVATARPFTRVSLCRATRDGFRAWLGQDPERLALVLRAALTDPLLVDAAAGGPAGAADAGAAPDVAIPAK